MFRELQVVFAKQDVEPDRGNAAPCQHIDKKRIVIPRQGPAAKGGDIVIIKVQDDEIGICLYLPADGVSARQHPFFEPLDRSGKEHEHQPHCNETSAGNKKPFAHEGDFVWLCRVVGILTSERLETAVSELL